MQRRLNVALALPTLETQGAKLLVSLEIPCRRKEWKSEISSLLCRASGMEGLLRGPPHTIFIVFRIKVTQLFVNISEH